MFMRNSGARKGPQPVTATFWITYIALLCLAGLARVLLRSESRPNKDSQTPPLQSSSGAKYGYATVLCKEDDAKAAMVLVHSIRNASTLHEVIILTRGISSSTRQIFTALGARVDPPPPYVPHADAASNITGDLSRSCLNAKISLWSLTQFSKLLYLEHSMLVLQALDEVFEHPQLTAAPDNDLPDRFNPSLMLLEPHRDTHLRLLLEFTKLQEELPPGAEDVAFFNQAFGEWPRQGPAHHLPYSYNAVSALGYSATWNEWVHPQLKAIRFSGPFERWNEMEIKRYAITRRYDHLRWNALRAMHTSLVQAGVVLPSRADMDPLCQADYMMFARGSPVPRKLSVLLYYHGQPWVLSSLIHHYGSLRMVHKIYILPAREFNSTKSLPAFLNGSTTTPVEVLPDGRYSTSSRLQPIESLETECVLLCDDRALVSAPVLAAALGIWSEQPQRIVGFFPSAHYRDGLTGELVFVPNPREEYSMVSTQMLLMHGDYLQSYTCSLLEAVRAYADMAPQCQDIVLNFMVAQISGTPPLLVMDANKHISESSPGLHLGTEAHMGSACLNDLEALLGWLPLQNSTEARVNLDHDIFSKVEFNDPTELAGGHQVTAEEVGFESIYDAGGRLSGISDENFRFMASIARVSSMPEVVVMPSPQHHNKILCLLGNETSQKCLTGGECGNEFAAATFRSIPSNALMLLGTTLVLHSRHGFDDHFHTPNILANLFYPYPDYGFMKPARALLYRRGSLDMRLSPWSQLLFQALLGDGAIPYRIRKGHIPVCFERAVITRHYRAVPGERGIVLRELQERAWAYCATMAANPVTGKTSQGFGFRSSGSSTLRVLLLHGDESMHGAIANLEELTMGLRSQCRRNKGCELLVVSQLNFTNLCQQVLHMGAANVFITASGDSICHVTFMRQGSKLLELVPYDTSQHNSRVVRMCQEAARWVGVDHVSMKEDADFEPCSEQDPWCQPLPQNSTMIVNVENVVRWLAMVRQTFVESIQGDILHQ